MQSTIYTHRILQQNLPIMTQYSNCTCTTLQYKTENPTVLTVRWSPYGLGHRRAQHKRALDIRRTPTGRWVLSPPIFPTLKRGCRFTDKSIPCNKGRNACILG